MSWRDSVLVQTCRWGVKPLLALPLPWALHRQAFRLVAPRRFDRLRLRVRRITLGGVPARVFSPREARGTLLWLHGGGFVLGSSRGYANLAVALALRSGRRVVVPDYRLAPEHPFPAAPDDCLSAARALAAKGPFALAGDSAGGTLALVTLSALLAEGIRPEGLILASPAVDLDPARDVPDSPGEALLPLQMLRRVQREYAGTADPRDPRVSPIHADFEGAPPVLIQCAAGELLEGDTDAIARRLRASGASVRVQKVEGVPHVWQLFAGSTPKADEAILDMAEFLGTLG